MLSVPLSWNDQVVGVLNVQTEQHARLQRRPTSPSSARSPTSSRASSRRAASRREAEAQVEQLRRIDEARDELIALVTHELRTPLAVVRAYTELLADDPPLEGRESRDPDRRAQRNAWHDAAHRPGRAPRPPRRLDPRSRCGSCPDRPADRRADRRRGRDRARSSRRARAARSASTTSTSSPVSACTPSPIAPRLRQILEHLHRERREVRAAGDDDHDRLDARRGLRPDRRHRRGPGHPRGVARADLRAVRPPRDAHGPRLGDRPVRREAARRVDGRAAVVRAGDPTGARFVVALPAAAAV